MKSIAGDMFGGLTAAIVALPLALAFGVQSGLGAAAGLYGAIALGILAALFGGTKTQISGPTGPMTVVAATVIASEIAYFGSVEAAMPSIVVTFVLAGALQMVMGALKLGQYIRYMPYPVISGFMSGIGLIIILLQIFPLAGLPSPNSTTAIIGSLGSLPANMNAEALILAFGTIATVYIFPRLTKKVPSTLAALLLFTVLSAVLGFNVPTIGEIPGGLPTLYAKAFFDIQWHDPAVIVFTALTLASLGAIDSLLTSVVADNMTRSHHDSRRELLGQGIGNIFSALIGGLPGAGATVRTVVNITAGGRTRLSGVTHGVVLLIILFGAGNYAALIPLPVLAGILVTVGIGVIDYRGLKDIRYTPRADVVIMLSVMLLTVFVDLLQAVGIGLVMAALWFMKAMGELTEEKSTGHMLLNADSGLLPDEQSLPEELRDEVYVQHFDGPIFFGFIFGFNKIIRALPAVRTVIFRMDNVHYIDQSGLYAFEDSLTELSEKGKEVFFVAVQTQPGDMFDKLRITPDLVPPENVFETFDETVLRIVRDRQLQRGAAP